MVATTPAGATDPLAATGWRADLPLIDVRLRTLADRAGAAAALRGRRRVVGGLAMLVGQAAEQVELMTGRPAPVAAMRAAGEAALAARTKHGLKRRTRSGRSSNPTEHCRGVQAIGPVRRRDSGGSW